MRDPSNLLLGQPDGTFVEGAEAAGVVELRAGRGAALVDLNLDGLLDLVVVNRRQPVALWRNIGAGDADRPMGGFVAVRLRQPSQLDASVPGSRRGSAIEQRAGRSRWAVAMPVVSSGGSLGVGDVAT